jgi:hypothetical protein
MILLGHVEVGRYSLILKVLLSLQISHIMCPAQIQVLCRRLIIFFIDLFCGDIEVAFCKSVAAGKYDD